MNSTGRNVGLLAACQAMLFTNNTTLVAINGLAGLALTPVKALGTLVWGVFNAYGQYYRFAAADAASADFRPTAISLVLAGGLVGGILGPGVSRWTIDLFDVRFMGAYLSLIAFALVTVALLQVIHRPQHPDNAETGADGRDAENAATDNLGVGDVHGTT